MVKSPVLDRFLHTGVPISVEYSTGIFHSLQTLVSGRRSPLPYFVSCELQLPWSPHTLNSISTQGVHCAPPGFSLLCMTGNSLKTLSWRHYAGAIRAHLMPFPSLKITILHCLMSGILKNHCFIYSNRRVNLIPVIPSQQEAEVPVCQVFSNYIHIANSKYQVSVLILLHISFWQADFSLTFCMKISGHMFIWFYLLLWPFLLSRLCWPAIHRLLAVKCLRV